MVSCRENSTRSSSTREKPSSALACERAQQRERAEACECPQDHSHEIQHVKHHKERKHAHHTRRIDIMQAARGWAECSRDAPGRPGSSTSWYTMAAATNLLLASKLQLHAQRRQELPVLRRNFLRGVAVRALSKRRARQAGGRALGLAMACCASLRIWLTSSPSCSVAVSAGRGQDLRHARAPRSPAGGSSPQFP